METHEGQQLYNFNQLKIMVDHPLSKDQFYSQEKKGELPTALRKGANGSYRYWTVDQVATVGEKYRSLSKAPEPITMSIYITKGGGSHKTTTAFNLARYYAMQGIKTLLIPLDFQMNLSKRSGFDNGKRTREETGVFHKGLYEVVDGELGISEVIQSTGFPNLDIIPESTKLVRLEVLLNSMSYGGENTLKNLIEPIKDQYELIIFDNNPSWSILSVNSIVASDVLVSPIGCDSNSFDTVELFKETIDEQLGSLDLADQVFIVGLTEQNSLKKQIVEQYHEDFPGSFLRANIRKSTTVDEAMSQDLSVLEYSPKSPVSEDYKQVAVELWERVVKKKSGH